MVKATPRRRAAGKVISAPEKSPAREKLEKDLNLASESLKVDSDPLPAEALAVMAIIDFLRDDPGFRTVDFSRPLLRLFGDLNDIMHGAKPAHFFDRPPIHAATKPTNQWRDMMQGQIVGAANLLIRAGLKREEATDWLAQGLAKQGTFHANGNRITASQISKWRERVNAEKACQAARETAEELRKDHVVMVNLTAEMAKHECGKLLATIGSHISPFAPPPNGEKE